MEHPGHKLAPCWNAGDKEQLNMLRLSASPIPQIFFVIIANDLNGDYEKLMEHEWGYGKKLDREMDKR